MKGKIKAYLGEVRGELVKVTWLSREMLRRTTAAVIVVMILVAIFFGIVDVVFAKVISLFVR